MKRWVVPGGFHDVMLLSFDLLFQDGALLAGDLQMLPHFDEHAGAAAAANEVRTAFLELASRRFLSQCDASPLIRYAVERFADQEAEWLDDQVLFEVLQKDLGECDWRKWPDELSKRKPEALDEALVSLATEIEERKALHYLLNRQVARLFAQAQVSGVEILGLPACSAVRDWIGTAPAAIELPSDCVRAETLFERQVHAGSDWRFTWPEVTAEVLKRLFRED
ncbi:MAG: 4-alpha-glucanotransferase [Verrucomicrobiaceae bacterium]|nr:4-alpha-glucanotransferase [Verrucomicrobiaceae bacterium]